MPRTGIGLQFWARLPLVDLSHLPPGLDRDFLPKEALEQALKDACQPDSEVLRPPPRPWVDRFSGILLAEYQAKTGEAANSQLSDGAQKPLQGIDGSDT